MTELGAIKEDNVFVLLEQKEMKLPCLDICQQPTPIAQRLLPCSRPLQTLFLEATVVIFVVQSRLTVEAMTKCLSQEACWTLIRSDACVGRSSLIKTKR